MRARRTSRGASTDATLWPFGAVLSGVAQFVAGMWAFHVRAALATGNGLT
jgi:hypothetical protein